MDEPWWQSDWEALCDKYGEQGYDALSSPEKVWVNVRQLIDETENGGLIAYFYNPGADTLADCLVALDTLGAKEVKREVERVVALFPGGVSEDIDERNEVIETWDDEKTEELLEKVDEKLYSLFEGLESSLEKYVRGQGLGGSSV